jgi:Ammonium Transporter Family
MNSSTTTVLAGLQAILLVLLITCTTTTIGNDDDDDDGIDNANANLVSLQYGMFRDIMVMLLVGFGFLMSFLQHYGLSAVGWTLLVTVLSMQLNLVIEPAVRYVYNGDQAFPIAMDINSLLNGEFAAATALISWGVIIGRASPLQLVLLLVSQAIFYAINKVMIVYGALAAEDVGGTCVCVCHLQCDQRERAKSHWCHRGEGRSLLLAVAYILLQGP